MRYHRPVVTMGPTRRRHSQRWAGNILRMVRAKRDWSQRELAAAAGVPQSTIGRIESGVMQPTLLLLDRIVVAAGFDLRTRLEPYDDHDDILDASSATRAQSEVDARQAAIDEFVSRLRVAPTASR